MKHRVINLSNGTQSRCGIANCNDSIKRSVSRKKVDLVAELEVRGNGKKIGLDRVDKVTYNNGLKMLIALAGSSASLIDK